MLPIFDIILKQLFCLANRREGWVKLWMEPHQVIRWTRKSYPK